MHEAEIRVWIQRVQVPAVAAFANQVVDERIRFAREPISGADVFALGRVEIGYRQQLGADSQQQQRD